MVTDGTRIEEQNDPNVLASKADFNTGKKRQEIPEAVVSIADANLNLSALFSPVPRRGRTLWTVTPIRCWALQRKSSSTMRTHRSTFLTETPKCSGTS